MIITYKECVLLFCIGGLRASGTREWRAEERHVAKDVIADEHEDAWSSWANLEFEKVKKMSKPPNLT